MRTTLVVVVSVISAAGLCDMAVAGSMDSPVAPSAGSGMYTLQQVYDYLYAGTLPTIPGSFQEPIADIGSTMKTTKQIVEAIATPFAMCSATADKVASGTTFFCTQPGSWGVQTGTGLMQPTSTPIPTITPTTTPTITATPPPPPSAGGEWVLVPGNATIGTTDFYVMKYEAKNVSGAYSQANTTPWFTIAVSTAATECANIGAHLCTVKEAQTINRNLEQVGSNWTGAAVGSGVLKRGNVGNSDSGNYDGPDPDYVGAGSGTDRTSTSPAKLVLSNGQEIWDWSGNLREYIWGSATDGSVDSSGDVTWSTTTPWIEWGITELNEERSVLGPSTNSYTSTQGMGRYLGGVSTHNFARGGGYADGASAGCFSLHLGDGPEGHADIGFRCCE